MPLAQISLWAGRSLDEKRKVVEEVTEAISRALDYPKDNIRVILYELPKENWGIGGKLATER